MSGFLHCHDAILLFFMQQTLDDRSEPHLEIYAHVDPHRLVMLYTLIFHKMGEVQNI